MVITEVRYRRVKNLGNYESMAVELIAAVNDDELPLEVLDQLKCYADEALGIAIETL